MELRLFDLHCDTPTELYGHCASLDKNSQHVSLESASAFSKYVQIMAIWSPWAMPDNVAFANFHKVADYLMNEFERLEDKISFVRTSEALDKAAKKQYKANAEELYDMGCAALPAVGAYFAGMAAGSGAYRIRRSYASENI